MKKGKHIYHGETLPGLLYARDGSQCVVVAGKTGTEGKLFHFRCRGQGSLEPEELVLGAEDDALCVADDELVVSRWVCVTDCQAHHSCQLRRVCIHDFLTEYLAGLWFGVERWLRSRPWIGMLASLIRRQV